MEEQVKAPKEIADLALLLTAGIELAPRLIHSDRLDGLEWLPTQAGRYRAYKAIQLFNNGEVKAIRAIGGCREGEVPNEADVYVKYVLFYCPEAIIEASSQETCTPRDIPAAMQDILDDLQKMNLNQWRSAKIGVITYRQHFERAEITLRHLGFENVIHISSTESGGYSAPTEWLLTAITRNDPEWRGLLGSLLVKKANKRIYLRE